jgi:hypothetical protein
MEKPPTVGGSLRYARVTPTNAPPTVADIAANGKGQKNLKSLQELHQVRLLLLGEPQAEALVVVVDHGQEVWRPAVVEVGRMSRQAPEGCRV